MKLSAKLGITTAFITLSFTAVGVNSAQAFFVGAYDVSNWKLTNTNADGSVNTSVAPAQIQLTGGNNESTNPGKTEYTIKAVRSGQVSFLWNYFTNDFDSSYDPFQFLLNNTFTDILNNVEFTGDGIFTTTVKQGDVFGFRLATVDNLYGSGNVVISNFNVVPVPEPSTIGGTVLIIGIGFGGFIKRKLAASKQA